MALVEIAASIVEKGSMAAEALKKGVNRITEFEGTHLNDVGLKGEGGAIEDKLGEIRRLSPEQLRLTMEKSLQERESGAGGETQGEVKELTDEERQKIKDETGWSDEIVNAIRSMEEYQIYKDAELVEADVGGKKGLIRSDINWDQVDEKGRTNRERVERGLSPLAKDGQVVELHHIGQHADSPLAELTAKEHRGNGNDVVLHNKNIASEVHGEGSTWNQERGDYWRTREI